MVITMSLRGKDVILFVILSLLSLPRRYHVTIVVIMSPLMLQYHFSCYNVIVNVTMSLHYNDTIGVAILIPCIISAVITMLFFCWLLLRLQCNALITANMMIKTDSFAYIRIKRLSYYSFAAILSWLSLQSWR